MHFEKINWKMVLHDGRQAKKIRTEAPPERRVKASLLDDVGAFFSLFDAAIGPDCVLTCNMD